MGVRTFQSNFTNGEISNFMEGRIDFAKYFNSVHEMENMLICPQGPATLRPGFRFIKETKTSSAKSRLIPFIFAEDDAFALEFGAGYIRFYKNRAQITKTYSAWAASTVYKVGALVTSGGNYYRCKTEHKSASSFDSSMWLTASVADTAYELYTPYTAAQVEKIKFCQSCDVLYLFHPSQKPQKLMRVADDDWHLREIKFNPPPLVSATYTPETTLTPWATTGTDITFQAGADVFLTGDVGRLIVSGISRAVITQVYTASKVICDIMDDFISTNQITSGSWKITGSPQGYLMPSETPDVGERVALFVDTYQKRDWIDTGVWTSLCISGEDNWTLSAITTEYYLKRSASCFFSQCPNKVYFVDGGSQPQREIPGTLGALEWDQFGWGDNDNLGYNTIYVNYGLDPDTRSSYPVKRSTANYPTHVFRPDDVGKYISIFGGIIKITGFVNSQRVTGEVVKLMNEDKAYLDDDSDGYDDTLLSTWNWEMFEGQWSEDNGYPSGGLFYEDRLFVAGVPGYPENIRGSVVGDYENFSSGEEADSSLDVSLSGSTVNKIRWIEPRDYLIVGTLSQEWRVGPEDTSKAFTPTNLVAKSQTTHGCADIDPLTVGSRTLFVQKALRKIREFTLNPTSVNNDYIAPDLTKLAEHMTEGKIAGMCYQQEPASIVWVWMANGDLASFTYRREEDIVGWQRHPVENGMVESMISIPGDGYDEVYAIIKRTVNGSTVRFIEVLEKLFVDDNETYQANYGENAFFIDSGITYNGAATTTITGLGHLEGEDVTILADGAVLPGKTVTGGQITLDKAASVVHAGLSYKGKLTTMRPEFTLPDGTSQGRTKRVINLIVRVKDSGTFKAGRDEDKLDEYGFAIYDQALYQTLFRTSDSLGGNATALYTGDKVCPFEGDYNRDARLTIVQDKPLPLTVVAITAEVDVTQ